MTGGRIRDGVALAGLTLFGILGIGALVAPVLPSAVAGGPAELAWRSDQWGVHVYTGTVTDSLTGCQYVVVTNGSGTAVSPRLGVPCDAEATR